jgi:transcriptional regulator, XRE family
MEKFHEKLKMLRKKKGLTQQEVAKLVHVGRGVYTNWELGNRNPNYENLSMLACVFDVSIDYLLDDYLVVSKERYLKLQEGKKKILEEDKLSAFCKKLPRAEFEDNERAKTVAIKAMRVVLLALGYDEDFVEDKFRQEIEKVIVVKRNI